ncbi:MAG TPA: 16S rRNA (cytosine(967)-C(5))-methyltransferase RsmB [Gammaproteobacteria bacterium]|nr:16S rRNA (cytosine(967)-C(5))-methyltransferase RsmB [Gammaproteobacteria bacterium]
MDARALAVKVLTQVLGERHSLDRALAAHLPKLKEPGARALTQEMCYGVLRWHLRLEALLKPLLHAPVKDQEILCLLLLGLYQLLYMRVATHAAVDSTVTATGALKKPWAKGLVNAILRGYLRNDGALLAELDRSEVATWAHPAWLITRLKMDWPQQWAAILSANNERPPLCLRVNARQLTRDAYLHRLAQEGIVAHAQPHTSHGIRVEKPIGVEGLPGFSEGRVSVQDGAAQLAAPLLDLQPGQRVLDACAAPGGKTCHILESQPALAELVAIDCDAQRVARIAENLQRLQLQATLVVGDAAQPATWWDGQPFDRILLDAPCSATGVIRRHPDIKLLRTEADITALAQQQAQLLSGLWPLLKSGGMLLYVTCSILNQENTQVVNNFLAAHPDARTEASAWPWQQDDQHLTIGQQIVTGEQGMDGFYYARLRKL